MNPNPARPISVGTRDGAGNIQGVEMPWPLISAQKGAKKYKPMKDIKRCVSTGAGE